MPDSKISLTIVVNGQPTSIDANLNAPMRTVIPQALSQTGNVGQPPENWELRDQNGTLLDVEAKVATFGFSDGTRLYLNLKAGIGG